MVRVLCCCLGFSCFVCLCCVCRKEGFTLWNNVCTSKVCTVQGPVLYLVQPGIKNEKKLCDWSDRGGREDKFKQPNLSLILLTHSQIGIISGFKILLVVATVVENDTKKKKIFTIYRLARGLLGVIRQNNRKTPLKDRWTTTTKPIKEKEIEKPLLSLMIVIQL